MDVIGKYGKAIIYNDEIEESAMSQVYSLMNDPMVEGSIIRIMPDIHAGSGCVIGYTATLTDKVVPNLVGVDIGCGLYGYNLDRNTKLKFDKLDKFIRKNIPSGRDINDDDIDEDLIRKLYSKDWNEYKEKLEEVCKRTNQDFGYALRSIGSMGGGNHYLELGKTESGELWIIVHSGSRNFGLKVALWHQKIAEESILTMPKDEYDEKVKEIRKTKKDKGIEVAIQKLRKAVSVKKHKRTGLEYLTGDEAEGYYKDMKVAQDFAELSRKIMIYKIVKFYGEKWDDDKTLQTTHNYISFDDKILRKGAVSAHKNEMLFIPMNMEYGTLLCRGKGNKDWNYSSPHGAGRLMSRSKAKQNISLEDFQYKMKGIWTSCVGKGTLDEAPQAYKKPDKIIEYLEPTVDIVARIKPLYNFKAGE